MAQLGPNCYSTPWALVNCDKTLIFVEDLLSLWSRIEETSTGGLLRPGNYVHEKAFTGGRTTSDILVTLHSLGFTNPGQPNYI